MSIELVEAAIGHSPVRLVPNDDFVMIHPVVPDEEKPVDLTVVKMGGVDLPDMGVIVAVGWKVNFGAPFDRWAEISEAEGPVAGKAFVEQAFYEVGDVVCVNRFSGLDVPGTNMVLLARADILGKLENFPVRLKVPEDVAQKVREARAEEAPSKSNLVLPA